MLRHIKCIKCGTFNTNKTYCTNCGAPLSYVIRREIAYKKAQKERQARERLEEKNNPSFFDKYGEHQYWIVRVVVKVLYSIWMVFIAIGTFIAWLVTAIAG